MLIMQKVLNNMQQSLENNVNVLAQSVSGLDKKIDDMLPRYSSKLSELEQKLEYLQANKSNNDDSEVVKAAAEAIPLKKYNPTDLFRSRINYTMSADDISFNNNLNASAISELIANTATDAFTGEQHLNMLVASCCTPKEILKNPQKYNIGDRYNLSQSEIDYMSTSAYSEHLVQPMFLGKILCETATTPLVDLIPTQSVKLKEFKMGRDKIKKFNAESTYHALKANACKPCTTFESGKYSNETTVDNIKIESFGRTNCVDIGSMQGLNYISTYNPITTLLSNMYNELMSGKEGSFIVEVLKALRVKQCSTDLQIMPNQLESAVSVMRKHGDVYIIVHSDSLVYIKNIIYTGGYMTSPINSVMSALLDDTSVNQNKVRWVCSDDVPKIQFAEGSNNQKLVDGSFVAYVIIPDRLATLYNRDLFTVKTDSVSPTGDCATISAWHQYAIHLKCLDAGYIIRAHNDTIHLSNGTLSTFSNSSTV